MRPEATECAYAAIVFLCPGTLLASVVIYVLSSSWLLAERLLFLLAIVTGIGKGIVVFIFVVVILGHIVAGSAVVATSPISTTTAASTYVVGCICDTIHVGNCLESPPVLLHLLKCHLPRLQSGNLFTNKLNLLDLRFEVLKHLGKRIGWVRSCFKSS